MTFISVYPSFFSFSARQAKPCEFLEPGHMILNRYLQSYSMIDAEAAHKGIECCVHQDIYNPRSSLFARSHANSMPTAPAMRPHTDQRTGGEGILGAPVLFEMLATNSPRPVVPHAIHANMCQPPSHSTLSGSGRNLSEIKENESGGSKKLGRVAARSFMSAARTLRIGSAPCALLRSSPALSEHGHCQVPHRSVFKHSTQCSARRR
jgi:hypothetical protein